MNACWKDGIILMLRLANEALAEPYIMHRQIALELLATAIIAQGEMKE